MPRKREEILWGLDALNAVLSAGAADGEPLMIPAYGQGVLDCEVAGGKHTLVLVGYGMAICCTTCGLLEWIPPAYERLTFQVKLAED